MFVMFLNTVTIGTELCSRLVIPVKSIPQKRMLTGAHRRAVRKLKGGYSTHPAYLENSTQMTAAMAWKTTRRMLRSPSMRWL